jgi:hypothetical protein
MGHDLAIIVMRNLLFIGSYGIDMKFASWTSEPCLSAYVLAISPAKLPVLSTTYPPCQSDTTLPCYQQTCNTQLVKSVQKKETPKFSHPD